MRKKLLILTVVFVMLLVTVIPAFAQDDEPDRVPLRVINRTGSVVTLTLNGDETGSHYFLAIPGSSFGEVETTFTIDRDTYSQVTLVCGGTLTGTLDASAQLRLVFVNCSRAPANPGEPTQQKISAGEPPPNPFFVYQHD
jgi:hypothetical protein